MTMPQFTYVRPKSLEETFRHLSTGNARIHAGGTDLLGCLHDGVFTAEKVVSISRLDELQGIVRTEQRIPADRGAHHRQRCGEPSPPQGSAIPPWYRPPGRSPARNCATRGRSGETSARSRGAGTTGGIFTAPGKGEAGVLPMAGENQYHCILGGKDASSCTPPTSRRRLWPTRPKSRSRAPRERETVPVEKFFVLPEQDDHPGDDPGAGRGRHRRPAAAAATGASQLLPEGAGARFLGFCPGRGRPGAPFQRGQGGRRADRSERRRADSVALSGGGGCHPGAVAG